MTDNEAIDIFEFNKSLVVENLRTEEDPDIAKGYNELIQACDMAINLLTQKRDGKLLDLPFSKNDIFYEVYYWEDYEARDSGYRYKPIDLSEPIRISIQRQNNLLGRIVFKTEKEAKEEVYRRSHWRELEDNLK